MYPVLFEIPSPYGPLPIYSYGVMMGTAMLLAWALIMKLGPKRENLSQDVMGNTFLITAVGAFVGSRGLYILTNPALLENPDAWLSFRTGGLVAYGGFIGGFLSSWAYLRFKKESLAAWADLVAPPLGIGLGFSRIGCYLFGCDYGARLSSESPSWLRGIGTFPRWPEGAGSPAYNHHVTEYGLSLDATESFAVHPTQLYESALGFILLGLTLWLWGRRRFRGQILLVFTLIYALWRFFMEYLRDDPERGFHFGFSTSQLISLAIVPVALFLYYRLRTAQGQEPLRAPESASV